jgi:hypothetical protein
MASKRKFWIVVMALALGITPLLAGPAAADSMNLSYRGLEGVTITLNNGSPQGSATAEFYSTSLFQGQQWIGYCVDIQQSFASPLNIISPDAWVGSGIGGRLGSNNWLEAAWLMEHYAPGMAWLDNNSSVNYGATATQNTIQAVQLAIWEVIINPSATYSSGSLGTGTFQASGGNVGTAGGMLEALSLAKAAGGGSVTLGGGYAFVIGQSDTKQDILLAAKTPEPATLFMAASGMGIMAWRRRRQKKA